MSAYAAGFALASFGKDDQGYLIAIDPIPADAFCFAVPMAGPYTNQERIDALMAMRQSNGRAATKAMKKKADEMFHPAMGPGNVDGVEYYYRQHSLTFFNGYWRPTARHLDRTQPPVHRNTNLAVVQLYGDGIEYGNLLCVYSTVAIAKGEWLIGPASEDGYGSGPHYNHRPLEPLNDD